jgi:PGF-CTERM motif
MFSTRFFIKLCHRTAFLRAQSTVSARPAKAQSPGFGSAAAVIGTLAVGWYGGRYYFVERAKLEIGKRSVLYPVLSLSATTPSSS